MLDLTVYCKIKHIVICFVYLVHTFISKCLGQNKTQKAASYPEFRGSC